MGPEIKYMKLHLLQDKMVLKNGLAAKQTPVKIQLQEVVNLELKRLYAVQEAVSYTHLTLPTKA